MVTAAALTGAVVSGAGALVGRWAAASPSPSPIEVPPDDQVSPGVLGFLVTFGVAVAAGLLFLSLVTQLRRVQHRAAADAEEASAVDGPSGAGAGPASGPTSTDPAGAGPGGGRPGGTPG